MRRVTVFLWVLGHPRAMGTLAGGVLGFSSHTHVLGVWHTCVPVLLYRGICGHYMWLK